MVYVINYDNNPLMPCAPAIARILLKESKAKVVRRSPFTIKLLYKTTSYTQKITLGVDTGSSHIGSAAVKDNGDVVYISEVEIRNDIAAKMTRRLKYRRNRRSKLRYRKARWQNRRNSIKQDRFSPTMRSKLNSHLKEVGFVESILPITKVILETAIFDAHALKNPAVLTNKWLYQKGVNYGYANTKAYVLDRDNYTCQNCKAKNQRLEIHHIIPRSNNGSDDAKNLITLCKNCHNKIHAGQLTLKKNGKVKGNLKHATQMNSIRKQLLKLLPEAEETFGFITKEHRHLLGLPKEHYIDAIVIACQGKLVQFKTNFLLKKKCVPDGDYQQTKGVRSEQKIPTGKINGFRKYDKVKYFGAEYFIKGRMSSGYAMLMDISGKKVNLKPIPKLSKLTRLQSRKAWIITQETIPSIY